MTLGRWTRWWFAPEWAANLAMARVLVGLEALWIVGSRDYAPMSDVPPIFWRHAPSLARFLIVPGHGDLERVLQVGATVALIGVVLGIAPRACCLVAAVLLYHLGPLEAAIWTGAPEARGLTLAPTALLILAAAPSGDVLALWPRPRAGAAARRSGRYGWALRLVQLLVVEIYLFSAIGKIERTGLDWGSAERIRLWLLWFNQDSQAVVFTRLGTWMADHAWMCAAIGIATFALEWLMPLALLWRPSRRVLVPAALAFHVGILLSMNIHVPEAWLVVVLVDWTALRDRIARSSNEKRRRTPAAMQPA